MENFFLTIQDFVLGLPDAIQFLGVVAVGAIPFIESYGAATIGIAQNEQIRAQEHPAVCTRQIKKKFTVMQDVSKLGKDGLTGRLSKGNGTACKKACLA